MKILKEGNAKQGAAIYRGYCHKCGCIFECNENERTSSGTFCPNNECKEFVSDIHIISGPIKFLFVLLRNMNYIKIPAEKVLFCGKNRDTNIFQISVHHGDSIDINFNEVISYYIGYENDFIAKFKSNECLTGE